MCKVDTVPITIISEKKVNEFSCAVPPLFISLNTPSAVQRGDDLGWRAQEARSAGYCGAFF
jgi:hypothetical protein